ncbi:hypothetical protein BV924_16425 [Pectobacterium odoriferum]|uniref:Uncharacterized protein n=1 Tax=Pectobacterium odoriferum TaxID=78398 RepID=A0ABD6VLP2_9GAMM|nr:hypothetical protein [Pectobacterium odoriferum]POD94216.1 hypothetical protein BVY06_16120 [Pectobacterium odoriferum]POE10747.1 hypothetical protein BV924_16425 [Pectobacterium odoriferum]POE25365.1 hypothetical protein BV926_16385 [Pectobacterium odoriferum]POE29729.1 hypothetical protein BV919_16405 [Pectobacterium odoriferum]POE38386.1 hypothetical protein BV920_16855 [Pectobacterium odoriferum]
MAKSSKIIDSLSEVKATLSEYLNKKEKLKNKINDINLRIGELQSMPMSLDDYCTFIPDFINRFGSNVFSSLKRSMTNSYNNSEGNSEAWGNVEKENGEVVGLTRLLGFSGLAKSDDNNLEILRYLCFLFPDEIAGKVIEALKNDTSTAWGNESLPPIAERREMVKELVEQRTSLEKELSDVSTEIQSINSLFSQMPQADTEENAEISSLHSDMVVIQHAPRGFSI